MSVLLLYSSFSQESESLESWMPQLQSKSWIFCPPQAVPSDLTYLLKYITNLYVEDEVTVGGVNHSPSFQACHCGGHTNWILFYVIHICDVIIFSVFYSFIFAWNINIIEKKKENIIISQIWKIQNKIQLVWPPKWQAWKLGLWLAPPTVTSSSTYRFVIYFRRKVRSLGTACGGTEDPAIAL